MTRTRVSGESRESRKPRTAPRALHSPSARPSEPCASPPPHPSPLSSAPLPAQTRALPRCRRDPPGSAQLDSAQLDSAQLSPAGGRGKGRARRSPRNRPRPSPPPPRSGRGSLRAGVAPRPHRPRGFPWRSPPETVPKDPRAAAAAPAAGPSRGRTRPVTHLFTRVGPRPGGGGSGRAVPQRGGSPPSPQSGPGAQEGGCRMAGVPAASLGAPAAPGRVRTPKVFPARGVAALSKVAARRSGTSPGTVPSRGPRTRQSPLLLLVLRREGRARLRPRRLHQLRARRGRGDIPSAQHPDKASEAGAVVAGQEIFLLLARHCGAADPHHPAAPWLGARTGAAKARAEGRASPQNWVAARIVCWGQERNPQGSAAAAVPGPGQGVSGCAREQLRSQGCGHGGAAPPTATPG
ncbi:translation initiation factor IF-2-like [Manacus candei]|uniref:translation initiation factor IF-2-like n=1 Tax=Manacus candei TaxID=415023 RepID=UPI002225D118|nr:translation initiation factor IF-2-like [Manacus candei]